MRRLASLLLAAGLLCGPAAAQEPAADAGASASTAAPADGAAATGPGPAPAAPALQTPTKGELVVAEAPAGAGARFLLVVGPCAKGECAISVELAGKGAKRGGKKAGKTLGWKAQHGAIVTREADHGGTTVVVGPPQDPLAVTLLPVHLHDGVDGVIVTEEGGFGAPTRRHDVLVSVKGAFRHAFQATEARVEWSAAVPLDLDQNGAHEIVWMGASPAKDPLDPDRFTMKTYAWDKARRFVVEQPGARAPMVWAAIVGFYQDVAQAREAKQGECLRDFLVLDDEVASLLPRGQVVVAALAPSRSMAEAALERAKACDGKIVGAVKRAAPGVEVE